MPLVFYCVEIRLHTATSSAKLRRGNGVVSLGCQMSSNGLEDLEFLEAVGMDRVWFQAA